VSTDHPWPMTSDVPQKIRQAAAAVAAAVTAAADASAVKASVIAYRT